MEWYVWLLIGLAGLFGLCTLILSVILHNRRNLSGNLCFVQDKGNREPALYVELNHDPKLYMNRRIVSFRVKIVKLEDMPTSRNSHFT